MVLLTEIQQIKYCSVAVKLKEFFYVDYRLKNDDDIFDLRLNIFHMISFKCVKCVFYILNFVHAIHLLIQ
jgi:hypothetical protein